jgi:hypothetical protein
LTALVVAAAVAAVEAEAGTATPFEIHTAVEEAEVVAAAAEAAAAAAAAAATAAEACCC